MGTPTTLPANWDVVAGFLIGPGVSLAEQNLFAVDLTGADLAGANLLNTNFTNANLTNANLANTTSMNQVNGVTWSNTTCPDGTNSDAHGATSAGHLAP